MGLHFNRCAARFLLVLVVLLLSTSMARAERRLPDLSEAMVAKDVIRLWGAPPERIERETKREEVWLYGESSVTFRAGKVVAWNDASRALLATQTVPSPGKDAAGTSAVKESDDLPVDALLEDIIGESEKAN